MQIAHFYDDIIFFFCLLICEFYFKWAVIIFCDIKSDFKCEHYIPFSLIANCIKTIRASTNIKRKKKVSFFIMPNYLFFVNTLEQLELIELN